MAENSMDMVCISCPIGCRMKVSEKNGEISVEGNTCAKGKIYAINEFKAPKRMLTTSVEVSGGDHPLVSVKTKESIPKGDIRNVLNCLAGIHLDAPVKIGDIILKNAASTGIDIVATRKINKI